MIDDSLFVQDQATGLYLPSQAQTVVHPWADLNALNPPAIWPNINPDIQSTLAILSAQGPDVPKLLHANFRRELRTASTINPSALVTAGLSAGGNHIQVDDASQFNTGQAVAISNGPTNPVHFIQLAVLLLVDIPNNIVVTAGALTNNLVVGDIVSVLPRVATVPDQLSLGGPPDAFFANFVNQAQPTQPTVFSIASIGNVEFCVGFFDVFMHVQPQTSYSASAFVQDSTNQDIWRGYIFAEGPDPRYFQHLAKAFNNGFAAGNSTNTILPAVVGQTYWVHSLDWETSAVAASLVTFEDTAGNVYHAANPSAQSNMPGKQWNSMGFGDNRGLVIRNNGAADTVIGSIDYSIMPTVTLKSGRVGFHKGSFLVTRGRGIKYGVDQPVPGQGILQLNIGIYLAD